MEQCQKCSKKNSVNLRLTNICSAVGDVINFAANSAPKPLDNLKSVDEIERL